MDGNYIFYLAILGMVLWAVYKLAYDARSGPPSDKDDPLNPTPKDDQADEDADQGD